MTYKAPTGSDLQGTSEMTPGAADVYFTDETPCGYDHTGAGTEMFWDGMVTQTVCKVALFLDCDGQEWLQHHLIPEDAEPLPEDTIAAFNAEHNIGALLDQLKGVEEKARALKLTTLLTRGAVGHVQQIYDAAKHRSLQLKDRDLARQKVEEDA